MSVSSSSATWFRNTGSSRSPATAFNQRLEFLSGRLRSAIERVVERAIERSNDRSSDRVIERPSDRASDRAI